MLWGIRLKPISKYWEKRNEVISLGKGKQKHAAIQRSKSAEEMLAKQKYSMISKDVN